MIWKIRNPDELRRRLSSHDIAFWQAYQSVEFRNIEKLILRIMGAEPEYTVDDPMPAAEMQDNLSMQLAMRRGNNRKT